MPSNIHWMAIRCVLTPQHHQNLQPWRMTFYRLPESMWLLFSCPSSLGTGQHQPKWTKYINATKWTLAKWFRPRETNKGYDFTLFVSSKPLALVSNWRFSHITKRHLLIFIHILYYNMTCTDMKCHKMCGNCCTLNKMCSKTNYSTYSIII